LGGHGPKVVIAQSDIPKTQQIVPSKSRRKLQSENIRAEREDKKPLYGKGTIEDSLA
jgi:hypothetical protein